SSLWPTGRVSRLSRRWLRHLAHHGLRVLVVARALEGWGAQGGGPRPFEELDLGDELRLHEDGALLRLAAVKRRVLALERLEQTPKAHEVLLFEAGAYVAGVHEAVAVVVADHE